jgi:lipoprotein-anchoring transpeptidase ErfK/SrfK
MNSRLAPTSGVLLTMVVIVLTLAFSMTGRTVGTATGTTTGAEVTSHPVRSSSGTPTTARREIPEIQDNATETACPSGLTRPQDIRQVSISHTPETTPAPSRFPEDQPDTGPTPSVASPRAARLPEEQKNLLVSLKRDPTETRQWKQEQSEEKTPISTPTDSPTATPPVNIPPVSRGKALVVDQARQTLYVYEDGVLIRALPVSTGVPHYYTPSFVGPVGYYVDSLYGYGGWADHAWYITKARGNIYIHSVPYIISDNGEKIYQGLEFLGIRPSSHGCIRLHPDDAEWLKEWDPEGVPIVITPLDFNQWKE